MPPLYQVDAFTGRPFAGNPAAVCLLPGPREAGWMQDVAREMNLAETAFLLRRPGDAGDAGDSRQPHFGWDLRWFTPTVEVDLCGHATLASAHVLWETGELPVGEMARFHSRSGLLTAERRGEWIELDFPAMPVASCEPPPGLVAALGAEPRWVGTNGMDLLVELPSEAAVRALAPDIRQLAGIETPRGVIATAPAAQGPHDFVSRFFAPRAGVDEDPVTGSAHCALGPFWKERLGRDELLAYQASARGGEIRVRVAGERVKLGGRAVTVLRGELLDPGE